MAPFPDPNQKKKKKQLTGTPFTPAPITAPSLGNTGNEPKILSQAERDAIAKANPGKVVDKYGNLKDGGSPQALAEARAKIEALKSSGGSTDIGNLSSQDRASQQQALAARQQQIQQALTAAGQTALTPEQLQAITGSNIDFGQAFQSGITAALPSAVGGAAAGAVAGAPALGVGAIPGAIGGAAVGGASGFYFAAKSNIAKQQTQQFSVSGQALQDGKKYLNAIIKRQNEDPTTYDENIAEFQRTLNLIDAAHAKTARDGQGDLAFWSSNKGQDKLADFEMFDSTLRADYINRFNQALLAPDPNKALLSQEEMQYILDNQGAG